MTVLDFASLVRDVQTAARAEGLVVPTYKLDPHVTRRSLRRREGGVPIVTLPSGLADLTPADLMVDLLEGLAVANLLAYTDPRIADVRARLTVEPAR